MASRPRAVITTPYPTPDAIAPLLLGVPAKRYRELRQMGGGALADADKIVERYSAQNVFLNVPYDRRYEKLFISLIAGLCSFGLAPRAALEIPGPTRRLDRILELMSSCRYSFHDLSRVQLSRGAPRFNMPVERSRWHRRLRG